MTSPPVVEVSVPAITLDALVQLFRLTLEYRHEIVKDDPDWEICDRCLDTVDELCEQLKDQAIALNKRGINLRGGL